MIIKSLSLIIILLHASIVLALKNNDEKLQEILDEKKDLKSLSEITKDIIENDPSIISNIISSKDQNKASIEPEGYASEHFSNKYIFKETDFRNNIHSKNIYGNMRCDNAYSTLARQRINTTLNSMQYNLQQHEVLNRLRASARK